MGLCASREPLSPEQAADKHKDKEIGKVMANDHVKDSMIQKLLLLGAGESGKSTLFKQIVDLYGPGISREEYIEFIPAIHASTVSSMQMLINQSTLLNDEFGTALGPGFENEVKLIMSLQPAEDLVNEEIATAVEKLWANENIKKTYLHRARFQMPVSAEYFFNKAHEIAKKDWFPIKQDILQCRVRTTGVHEIILTYEQFRLKLVDVGGQRNERKKWINQFAGVNAVIFVAAISEYDQVLFEDEKTNRLIEALELFDETINLVDFKHSSIILFLNKRDLFAEKIHRSPLKSCFPDYDGPNEFDEGSKFIATKFLARRKDKNKDVYVQITCATDDTNVKFVFGAVRDIVVQKALQKSGLISS